MSAESVVHVIDDDDAVRDSLEFLLRSADIEVVTHPSALAFLEALPGTSVGCIVTDVRMPDLDGIELLRRVRSGGNSVPVIVMTGHGDISMAVEAMKTIAMAAPTRAMTAKQTLRSRRGRKSFMVISAILAG